MIVEVCDICKKNKPDKKIKIKLSKRNFVHDKWSGYKKIYICQSCAEKILVAMKKSIEKNGINFKITEIM